MAAVTVRCCDDERKQITSLSMYYIHSLYITFIITYLLLIFLVLPIENFTRGSLHLSIFSIKFSDVGNGRKNN